MSCSDDWIFINECNALTPECDGDVAAREMVNHHGTKTMCQRHHDEHVEIIELYLHEDPENPGKALYLVQEVLAMTPAERHQAWLDIQE